MRKSIYLILFSLVILFTACGGKKGDSTKESEMALSDSADASGLHRLPDSKNETSITFKGKEYHSVISRTTDESLPHVKNDTGDTYVDNKIELRLTRGNEVVYSKTFTKNDFASLIDTAFLPKSILEGCVYDKTTPNGIVFAVSVSYPQTDLYVPLSVTISADGKMSISKAELIDEEYGEDVVE